MNPSSLSGAMAAAASVRPSLFPLPGVVPTAMADPSDALRILSSVPAPSAARPALRWGWMAAGALAALGLLATLAGVIPTAREGRHEAVAAAQPTPPARSNTVGASVSAPATVAVATLAEASQAGGDSSAARIETAPAGAAMRDPFSALEPSLGGKGVAAASTAPAASAASVQAAVPTTASAMAPTTTPPASAHSPRASARSADDAGRKSRSVEGEGVARANGKALTTAVRPDDSDVDLLEAMVARVAGKPVAPANSRSAGTPPDASLKTAAADKKSADKKASKSGDKSNDKPTDKAAGATSRKAALADQVQHCREVGGLEGWLCRNRVCDGHWGTDAACPLSSPTKPQEP